MKKALLIFLALLIFSGLVVALLDVFDIWSITDLISDYVRTHSLVQPYLLTAEEREELERKINQLQVEVLYLKDENDEIKRINQNLEDIVGSRDERISYLEDELNQEEEVRADRAKRLDQLARVYEEMSPDDAALVLQGLEDDLVINLFLRWEDRFAARVLAEMDNERSARLTEILSQ